jgi:cytochrome oxidase assembly protein ShyY1
VQVEKIEGIEAHFNVERPGPPSGDDVDINLVSSNNTQRLAAANAVESILESLKGVSSIERNDKAGKARIETVLDFDAMSERLGYDLLPVVIRFSPKANNGYLRQWNIVNMGPERHLGYAFQWYALAVAMLGVLLVLALKKKSNL